MEGTRCKDEYVYLLYELKYDYLLIHIDEGYFSRKRYSFRISFDSIKYKDELILPGVDYEDFIHPPFPRERIRDPKKRWIVKFKNDVKYLKDFSGLINKVKKLAFNSVRLDRAIMDGASFFMKLGHHENHSAIFSDYFEMDDSAYVDIKELVKQFLEKWAVDSYFPWSDYEQ